MLADWGPVQHRKRETPGSRVGRWFWLRLALMVTAYLGRASELKALLQLPGANLNPASAPEEAQEYLYLFPPLMSAGLGGYFNTVKVLMRAGVSLESRNGIRGGGTLPCGVMGSRYTSGGENILHFAALGGHVKLVRFVLREWGGAAQAVDGQGHTPLVWALVSGQTAVARELLEWRDGDPMERKKEMRKKEKKNKKQQGNTEILRPDEETQENTMEADALTLFRYALRSQKLDPVINAFPAILEQEEALIAAAEWGTPAQLRHLLSVQQTPMTYRGATGATVLHHAIYSGNREKVQIVLGQPGVDINIHAAPGTGHDEETPLHAACAQTAEIVKLLLAHPDVDLLSLDSNGRTPLMNAASWGRHDICNLLLLEQSDVAEIWRTDFTGRTILSIAAFAEDEKLLRRFLCLSPGMDVVNNAISVVDEYLAGPRRLPKKLQHLLLIRERQERVRNGTYRILVQYREGMGYSVDARG
ncbi:ankyrin repeat domain-containing protein [Aspergillus lucknowensis]|uniref:Ankyrin repeat-containing domain protein n=1 Tax=Aspergillus lucknowensis TaxID=176173 RepID=A0ABR4LDR1_9EURO